MSVGEKNPFFRVFRAKWLAGGVLVGLWAAAVWLAGRAENASVCTIPLTTDTEPIAKDCAECHPEISEAWASSGHARAAASELFRARMATAGNEEECLPCHAPQPVLRTGLGNEVLVRTDNRQRGVDCESCHGVPEGVAARNANPSAPCSPVASEQLCSDAMCGVCHRSIYRDTLRARWYGLEADCVDCHMRSPGSGDETPRVDHAIGVDSIGGTVELRVTREDGVRVEVVNNNPAHAFPGERHNRVVLLRIEVLGDDGELTSTDYVTVRAVIPYAAPRRDDAIAAGGSFVHTLPPIPAAVRVSLLYKRVPWVLHTDAQVLHQASIPAQHD